MWFKVILNKDLSIASCEQVDNAYTEQGKHIVYCEADSREAALKYAKILADSRIRARERRHAAKLADRCGSCGYERTDPRHDKCKTQQRKRAAVVRQALAAGAEPPPPLPPRAWAATVPGTTRSRILTEVREHYVRMSREDFFAWLEAEIKASSWRRTA